MTRPSTFASLSLITCLAAANSATAQVAPKQSRRSYRDVMLSVADMVNDGRAQELLGRRGLELLNVLWEDTGRWEGSSVGPNISDVTIEVQTENARGKLETALMPVIRYPDFTDKTGDIQIDKIQLRVGNQLKGGTLETISLRKLLENPLPYMSDPERGKIKKGTLLAKRDSHVLVSAQAAFLPVPKQGKATFWPVIFNYQSYQAHPAVLTILVTREGTSITVVDNSRDTVGGSWGQRLFFNEAGQRTPLTAVRLSDAQAGTAPAGASGQPQAPLGDDANVLMLIQVPLKVKQRAMAVAAPMSKSAGDSAGGLGAGAQNEARRSDVEAAVLGHGPKLGPYSELAGLTIERDPRFPVRATIQFYQATSNGVLSAKDAKGFATQIRKVYRNADYVGSLVVPNGQQRPTQWWGVTTAPAVTWQDFAGLVERFERLGLSGLRWPTGAVAR